MLRFPREQKRQFLNSNVSAEYIFYGSYIPLVILCNTPSVTEMKFRRLTEERFLKRKKLDVYCTSLETGEKLRNKGLPLFSQAQTSSGCLVWMGSVAGQGRRAASGLLPTE